MTRLLHKKKKLINLPRLIRRHNIPYLVTRVRKQLQKKKYTTIDNVKNKSTNMCHNLTLNVKITLKLGLYPTAPLVPCTDA